MIMPEFGGWGEARTPTFLGVRLDVGVCSAHSDLQATKNGNKLEVMFDEVVDGGKLILRKTHIEGAKPGEIGIKQLKDLIREYGKERGFKQVIVEGGKRTTGRMKGKTPGPMVIDID